MLKIEIEKTERDALIDCIGLVIQTKQDPRQTIMLATQLLPIAAKLQASEEIKTEQCETTSTT